MAKFIGDMDRMQTGAVTANGTPAPALAAPDFAKLVGPAAWARLTPAIRRRFSRHEAEPVRYAGTMQVACSSIGRMFAFIALLTGGPLPTGRASAAVSHVDVSADGAGGVVWARTLHLDGGKPTRVVSTKRLARDGALLECVRGGLGMVLCVYEKDAALVFESTRYFFNIFGLKIPIAALLTPGRCRVVHAPVSAASDARRFRFTMDMDHPIWGQTFYQSGVFTDPEG